MLIFEQRETVTDDHGRILKNRIKIIPPPFDPANPPLYVAKGTFTTKLKPIVRIYNSFQPVISTVVGHHDQVQTYCTLF